jgi:outer membrane protein TolC
LNRMTMKTSMSSRIVLLAACLLLLQAASGSMAQSAGGYPANSIPTPRPLDPATNSTNPSASATQSQNPYLGSVPMGPVDPANRPISLNQAVQMALRSNLGLIDTEQQNATQRAARVRALSALLPHLNASASQHYALVSTLPAGGRELALPNLVGPLSYETLDLDLRQSVFDASASERLQSASQEAAASAMSNLDSRNIVVLAAASAYITIAASESRVHADQAQQDLARALEDLMRHRVEQGVSPQIDLIRAQVANRTAEQRLDLAHIQLEKDKLALTRIIGLPIEQQFTLTTPLAYKDTPYFNLQTMLDEARLNRSDLKAACAMAGAARSAVKTAEAERLPSIGIAAHYGGTGITAAHLYNTYDVGGSIRLPLFTGGAIASDVSAAKASQARREAELSDLEARVQYDVRSAYLDLEGARRSVSVAQQNLDLAREGLKEARDRLDVGLSNGLEVMEAQQTIAGAEDNYISSVYAHNLAKLMLIRSTGTAEKDLPAYAGGN